MGFCFRKFLQNSELVFPTGYPGPASAKGFSLRCSVKLKKNGYLLELFCPWLPVADPGFPRRRGRTNPRVWANLKPITDIWQDFCRKLHENEKNWTDRRVGGGRGAGDTLP